MRIVFLDTVEPAIASIVRRLMPEGWSLVFVESATEEARATALGTADVAFVIAAPVTAKLIDGAPRLRLIQKLGAGVDRVDQAACRARKITLARLAASNATPVAEHTLLLMMAALRRLPLMDRRTRAGHWDKERGRANNQHLSGKTVGLLGCGAIGRAVAELLSSFRVEILYHDPVRLNEDAEKKLNLHYVDLNVLLQRSDILSLHLPLTEKTKNIVDRNLLATMKSGAVLVNCARGALVDETALIEALESGHLFAAALDVFATEPPLASPLLQLDSVVVTPHLAGATINNFESVIQRAIRNVEIHLAGGELPHGDVVLRG